MGTINTGNKIKELRLKLGFSQEQLSEESGISLRTIQRIEKGNTIPRGYSLRQISRALNVDIEQLTFDHLTTIQPVDSLKEDPGISFILIISGFAYLINPVLGIIIPGTIWILYKATTKGVFETGRRMIQYQLTFCAVILILYLYAFVNKSSNFNLPTPANPKSVITFISTMYLINGCAILLVLISWCRTQHKINKKLV
jgi:transcriptional regulator with XRE-family HTH domain